MFFSSSPQPLVNGAHLCEELTRFLSEKGVSTKIKLGFGVFENVLF